MAKIIPKTFAAVIFSSSNKVAIMTVTKKLNPLNVETILTFPKCMEVINATKATAATTPAIMAYSVPFNVMNFCFVKS